MLFKSTKPHYEYLRKKWKSRARASSENLIEKHLRHIALGSLSGLMLLPTSGLVLNASQILTDSAQINASKDTNKLLAAELKGVMPTEVRALTPEEEQKISSLLSNRVGIKVTPEIDGKRLNRSYGLMGGEQHLYRYPGDGVYDHAKTTQDWAMYGGAGIAPGLGAWGYFAPSKEQFTQDDDDKERWYIAVQTFLSPGFSENVGKYRDFYKYRKMLVVNPETGQAVIADIADAGPSEWTGKHLGGSPEVMQALGLAEGPRKGAVLYFFIDDSQSSINLGPVTIPERGP